MKSIYFEKALWGCSIVLLSMSSCMTDDYDLSKDISLDVSVGGDSLSFPLGSGAKSVLGDKITQSGMLTQDAKGNFVIAESAELAPVSVNIDPVSIKLPEVDFQTLNLNFEPYSSARALSGMTSNNLAASIANLANMIVKSEFPKGVEVITDISTGDTIRLKAEFIFSDYGNITEIMFQDAYLEFPAFVKLYDYADPAGRYHIESSTNRLVVSNNVAFDLTKPINLEVKVKSFVFPTGMDASGITSSVKQGGKVVVVATSSAASIKAGGIDNMKLTTVIENPPIVVKQITGIIDPKIDPLIEKMVIDLGDDADFLKSDASLSFTNPQIALTLGNTLELPFNLDVKLTAKEADGTVLKTVTVNNVKIDAALQPGIEKQTELLFSAKETTFEGKNVVVPDLSTLFKVIPDSLIVEIQPSVDSSQEYTYYFGQDVVRIITGSYHFSSLLQFDHVELTFDQKVDGLNKSLKDIAEKATSFDISIKSDLVTTIPLELSVTATPTDLEGNFLPGVDLVVDGTILSSADGTTAVTSKLVIKLTEKQSGQIAKMEGIDFKFHAKSSSNTTTTNPSAPLKVDQYLQFTNMMLISNGGLNLDLNK